MRHTGYKLGPCWRGVPVLRNQAADRAQQDALLWAGNTQHNDAFGVRVSPGKPRFSVSASGIGFWHGSLRKRVLLLYTYLVSRSFDGCESSIRKMVWLGVSALIQKY